MARIPWLVLAVLVVGAAAATANPGGTDIVINEIYCDPVSYYDGAEFIELYNPTGGDITITGWVLTGTEYAGVTGCGGEDLWQFPDPTIIGAGDYLVVAKDGWDGEDGFYEEFNDLPQYEMYDASASFDSNSIYVADMILLTDDPATIYSDEIQLVGGRGYGPGAPSCSGYNQSDVVYLYDGDPRTAANLIDLVEYTDPDLCTTDPCTTPLSDDGADDNAFQGIPYVGNSLGRDPSGTDTDMSINDWTIQAPTPGAVNVLNSPPWIRTVRYSPIPPVSTDPTTISAIVTDDGGIDSVMVYYSVNGGSWGTVAASTSDSLYTGDIPAQVNGAVVDYFVRAVDDLGAVMNYPAEAMGDPYSYRVNLQTIHGVQFAEVTGGPSPEVGKPVNLRGIVTMGSDVRRDDEFWFHEGTGRYKGVKVYNYGGFAFPIDEGDDVTVCGTVSEYYDETEIYMHFDEAIVVHSKGNPTYGYTDITTAMASALPDSAERYEGQLVRVSDATVTLVPDTYGIWNCRDSSGQDARVDDSAYYTYEPEVLDVLAELGGILIYHMSEYKIEPRDDDDIVGPPRVGDVRYNPIPPSNASATTISAVFEDNVDITSATLHWSLAPITTHPSGTPVTMTESARYEGTWTADIPAQVNGTRVYYYVEGTDGTMDVERPSAGSYSYYTGVETIYNVQYVPPGGDASPMDTLAVNVEGYVTAEPGLYNDNTFFIQDATGVFNGIMVYDRSGTVSFERGDYVVCCGEVNEYYGQTQIELHFSEGAQLATPPARGDMVDPVVISETYDLQSVVGGEQYESVFVIAEDCTVVDEDLGYGEWSITNSTAGNACIVADYAAYDYVPQNGDNVYVRGIVFYVFSEYKIEPRGNEDIAANPVGVTEDYFGGKFGLAQNMPNPFNPKTAIAFTLSQPSDVRLEVYDVIGRRITTLVDAHMVAGPHRVYWDGRTADGERAASGVYFYKLVAGDEETSRKMVLLK